MILRLLPALAHAQHVHACVTMHPAHEYNRAHLRLSRSHALFLVTRALSTEMQLGVEMPDKGSETKVESEVENPVHSKPKLDFIKVNVPDNLQFDRNH